MAKVEAGEVGEAQVAEERKEGKFVFAITASGWHSGALAVEIGEKEGGGSAEKEEEEEEGPRIRLRDQSGQEQEQRMPGGNPPVEQQGQEEGTGFAGLVRRGFRVGFAGRGLGRGMRGVGR